MTMMMNRMTVWPLALLCVAGEAVAQTGADSVKVVDIEEAVVVASPKETSRLRRQPVSASLFGEKDLRSLGVADMKGLSAYAPNFYMPDYGSRLTSAVYIRGIGSRINTPAVGLYVDNVPFADKSAYDFSFIDVERVDVLRGPQGTLYGRNSMGGLIRVFTADPFVRKGADVSVGASTRNGGRKAQAVAYMRPSERVALSVGGFYEGQDGFYRNVFSGGSADASDAGGGKFRLAWRPSADLRLDLTAAYEYSDEQACPYYYMGGADDADDVSTEALPGVIQQNRPSEYRRSLLNTGLSVEWKRPDVVLSSITSFQYLKDRMFMDQDFTAADVFSLEQRQRMQVLTQELSVKSVPARRWQWASGLFFMYEGLKTGCPVNFYADGVDYLNGLFASALPAPMSLRLTDGVLPFDARFRTPVLNAALFHQSTVKLGGGLSAIVGARLDYDHRELKLSSGTGGPVGYTFAMPPMMPPSALGAEPVLDGRLRDDSWQLLPKLALQYDHRSGRGNVYVAVSKGYRSGGYNIQSYSDLSQTSLRRAMMSGVRDYAAEAIGRLPLPEPAKENALKGMNAAIDARMPSCPDVRDLAYRPEQSWNYELGGHLTFLDRTLRVDYTFFYMNTKDQQLARFSDSGMGRVMVNAGKSRSCGAELSVRSSLFSNRLNLSLAYGYTDARLTEHDLGQTEGERVDYSDNRVPFVPEHTLGASFVYRQPCGGRVVKACSAGMNLDAAGRFYWDEANSFSQPFYARVGATLSVELAGGVSVELWGKNLTGTDYDTFAFESFGRRFAQRGVPRHFGMDVRLHF